MPQRLVAIEGRQQPNVWTLVLHLAGSNTILPKYSETGKRKPKGKSTETKFTRDKHISQKAPLKFLYAGWTRCSWPEPFLCLEWSSQLGLKLEGGLDRPAVNTLETEAGCMQICSAYLKPQPGLLKWENSSYRMAYSPWIGDAWGTLYLLCVPFL